MKKQQIINQFAKHLIVEEQRKNGVKRNAITTTLVRAALDLAFVHESCKSSGRVSKSQVIYRKIGENTKEDVKDCFQEATIQFLKLLKIFSRNRKFILSFDTTEEAFYGKFSKADEPLYLHGHKSTRLVKKFRLVFSIDEKEKAVYLEAIDDRKDIY